MKTLQRVFVDHYLANRSIISCSADSCISGSMLSAFGYHCWCNVEKPQCWQFEIKNDEIILIRNHLQQSAADSCSHNHDIVIMMQLS